MGAFAIVLMGGFGFEPLVIVTAVATSLSVTEADIAVGLFIIGTFINLILMFWNAANL